MYLAARNTPAHQPYCAGNTTIAIKNKGRSEKIMQLCAMKFWREKNNENVFNRQNAGRYVFQIGPGAGKTLSRKQAESYKKVEHSRALLIKQNNEHPYT
jgi:hypothetical protein